MKTNVFTTKETIFGQVEVVRLEIESKQKRLSASDEELVQKIWDKVVADNREFATEKEQLRYLSALTRELVWQEANTEESDEIISRLKSNDQLFAQKFFYGESIRMQHQPFPLKDTLKHQADLQGGCFYRRVRGYTLYFPLEQWHMEHT